MEEITCTITEMARAFGMHAGTIRTRLADVEPVASEGRAHKWRLGEAARAVLQVDSETLNANHEIARVNARRADKLDLENAVTRREQVPVALVVAAAAATAGRMAACLDALPAELKRANPNLTHTDLAMVKRAIAKARNEAADIEIDWSALDD